MRVLRIDRPPGTGAAAMAYGVLITKESWEDEGAVFIIKEITRN